MVLPTLQRPYPLGLVTPRNFKRCLSAKPKTLKPWWQLTRGAVAAEDGAPAEWGGEVAVAVLNTGALVEAALILRTHKALLVSDTLTMVRPH